MNIQNKTKVIVGISGGVDSAVAAFLLKEQGYDVEGTFMQNWTADQNDPYCTITRDLQDAKAVCEQLQIPLHIVNFANEYWQYVFTHFLDEYAAGRTPNPDVLCNKEIKFKAFLYYAINTLGADYIATGHYAKIRQMNTVYQLLRGIDINKDQSYFLHLLNQSQLAKSLFPLGDIEKQDVRAIAHKLNLVNAAKKDSTGICFIGERKFKEFLKEFLLTQPGEIVDNTGKMIGKHDGLMFYTIGQRKGLGIGGKNDAKEAGWYVVDKDLSSNRLLVAQGQDHPALWRDSLTCVNVHWINVAIPQVPFECTAQIRYRGKAQSCTVTSDLNSAAYCVKFHSKQWAISPGQSVVFYQDEVCLGGGVIS